MSVAHAVWHAFYMETSAQEPKRKHTNRLASQPRSGTERGLASIVAHSHSESGTTCRTLDRAPPSTRPNTFPLITALTLPAISHVRVTLRPAARILLPIDAGRVMFRSMAGGVHSRLAGEAATDCYGRVFKPSHCELRCVSAGGF